jgi:hypothetical protein
MLRIVNNPPIIRVRLKYPDVVSFAHKYSHRFTSKGLFLVVKTPSLPGAQVRFELLLEGGDVVFAGLGEITWIKPFPDSKGFYGMIIRFITLDDGCQEILQLALSHKDSGRKDAFDHQKIAEDQLPDDQVDTTPFISQRRLGLQPEPEDLATNRYPTVQAGEPSPQQEEKTNAKGTVLENRRPHPEDDDDSLDEEAPTEDSSHKKRGQRVAPSRGTISDFAPTNKTPSLAIIEGIAAQTFKPRHPLPPQDDPSDVTTHDNIVVPKIQASIFGKPIALEDDAPTDSSTKEIILPSRLPPPDATQERDEDLDITSLADPEPPKEESLSEETLKPGKLAALTPPAEEDPSGNIAFAITKEQEVPPKIAAAPLSVEVPLPMRNRPTGSGNDPTSIRIMVARPIPTHPAEQDIELEKLANEVGLADLDSLVGWSKEVIKNLPRTSVQIERELMALAIAAKKLY